MTAFVSEATLFALLVLCRVGGCFLVLPGLSGSRIPAQVRIMLVVGISVSLLSLVWDNLQGLDVAKPAVLARLMVFETIIGLFIGLSVRFFLLALGFMVTAMGTVIGYGNLMGPGFEETEPQAALGTLLTMSAVLLLFIFDFHHMVIMSLMHSYELLPANGLLPTEAFILNLGDALKDSFFLVLRLGSPFIAYALVVNLMIGVLNKLTPQIPIYFVSLPFIIFGGLILLYFALPSFLTLFVEGFFDFQELR